jgi:signal peptidase II
VKRSFPLLLGVAGALVALDQWTKHLATAHLAARGPVPVVGDLVRLTYARNSGIAFSLFAGRGFPLWLFSLAAATAVLVLFARAERMPAGRQWALAFILGGAVGNFIDRVSTGQVVDFILLAWGPHEFPVFNVADIAVTCGVALFALGWSHDTPHDAGTAPAAGAADTPPDGEDIPNDEARGPAGPGAGSGTAGGPLAREGPDRPLA